MHVVCLYPYFSSRFQPPQNLGRGEDTSVVVFPRVCIHTGETRVIQSITRAGLAKARPAPLRGESLRLSSSLRSESISPLGLIDM